MTAVTLKEFRGMVPRSPPELLPEGAAAYASNCDFSKNILGALKGGQAVATFGDGNGLGDASVDPIRGIYTLDGLYWYTWGREVVAHPSPVIGDTYDRIYFIDGGTVYAAKSPESLSGKADFVDGGEPSEKYKVGVPYPTTAPKLTLVDRTTLSDYPSAALTFKVWWTDGAARYGSQTITATLVTAFKRYSFTMPSTPGDVPEGSYAVVEATLAEGTKQLFQLNTSENSTAPTKSSALPGGIEMSLEKGSGTTYYVNFAWGVVDTRAYVFTMVNTWAEEGAPSPAAIISPTYLQDVLVELKDGDGVSTIPSFTNYRPQDHTNVYRTFGSNAYIKIGTIAASGTSYTDSAHTVSSVGTALTTLEYIPPPSGLFGLVSMPNGWFAAFKGNTLYMSEPYRPHTWQYSVSFPFSIRGICAAPQSLVVTTADSAYIVNGPHPASVNSMELSVPCGGISHRSMTKLENGVAFLSNEGIVVVDGSQASLTASQNFWTRQAWRDTYGDYLDELMLAYHDGFLVCVSNGYKSGVATNDAVGFLLRLDEATGALTHFNYQFNAMLRLPVQDTLYYAVGRKIYRFRESDALGAVWYSRETVFKQFTKFGAGYLRANGTGTVTLQLYVDGAAMTYWNGDAIPPAEQAYPAISFTVDASHKKFYFRLPGAVSTGGLRWQVRLTTSGAVDVHEVALAQTMGELRDV